MAGRTNEEMTGAEMVLKALADPGCRVMFGYPGGAVLPIMTRFSSRTSAPHSRAPRAGCSARGRRLRPLDRKARRLLVDLGAGATNAVTGLTNALMDSTRSCASPGSTDPSYRQRRVQECDTVGITRPYTKHNYLVKNVTISRASCTRRLCRDTGRPGRCGGYPKACSSRAQICGSEQHPA